MEATNLLLGLSNLFVSFLIIGISIPLVMGKVPINKMYGIRFRKSYETEETWYKVNHYGGKQLIIWSIPLALLGFFTLFLTIKENVFLISLIACAPLIVLVPVFKSYRYSKKL